MRRNFFIWITAFVLLISVPVSKLNAAEGGFTDIGDHWAKAIIEKFTTQGTLSGYPDGTFKPDGNLTRAEAISLLNKFFNIEEGGYPTFTDVRPGDWHYFKIGAAEGRQYVTGFADGTFKPNENITRLQAFIMIYRLLGEPEHNSISSLSRFSDYHSIPNDMPNYGQIVDYMITHEIINAYGDGTLRVNDLISRAEMLALLDKVSDMITNQNSILPESPPQRIEEPEEPGMTATYTPTPTEMPQPSPTPPLEAGAEPAPEPAPAPDVSNRHTGPRPPGNWWQRTSPSSLETIETTTTEPDPEGADVGFEMSKSSLVSTRNPRKEKTVPSVSPRAKTTPGATPSVSPSESAPESESTPPSESTSPSESSPPSASIAPSVTPSATTGADTSASENPSSHSLSGFGFFKNHKKGENSPKIKSGNVDIQENSIVITDSDKASLTKEYTLQKGMKLVLKNSTLYLYADLNVIDKDDLIGDFHSTIVEKKGFLSIGECTLTDEQKLQITPDSYYFDCKNDLWKAIK
jgi:hypothetical protein